MCVHKKIYNKTALADNMYLFCKCESVFNLIFLSTKKIAGIENKWYVNNTRSPGGGLDKPTERDQRSWVFLNYPKKYFAADRKPQKILFERQNPKKYPPKSLFILAKVKHDTIIMENRDY